MTQPFRASMALAPLRDQRVPGRPLHCVQVGRARREVRRQPRKRRPELRRDRLKKRLRRPVPRDVAAAHLAALDPVPGEPISVPAHQRRMRRRPVHPAPERHATKITDRNRRVKKIELHPIKGDGSPEANRMIEALNLNHKELVTDR